MDRESLVKLQVIERILDKDAFEELLSVEPFAASILLESFKEFLDDDYFERVERQLTLYKFLRMYYPLSITVDILDHASTCSLKDDYTRLILEWNLVSSDYIKKYNLSKYDCSEFAMKKDELQNHNADDSSFIIVNLDSLNLEGLDYNETD